MSRRAPADRCPEPTRRSPPSRSRSGRARRVSGRGGSERAPVRRRGHRRWPRPARRPDDSSRGGRLYRHRRRASRPRLVARPVAHANGQLVRPRFDLLPVDGPAPVERRPAPRAYGGSSRPLPRRRSAPAARARWSGTRLSHRISVPSFLGRTPTGAPRQYYPRRSRVHADRRRHGNRSSFPLEPQTKAIDTVRDDSPSSSRPSQRNV